MCSSVRFLFLWPATNAWGPLGCHVFQITQPFLAWVPEWLCRAEPLASPTVRSTQRVQWIRHKLLSHQLHGVTAFLLVNTVNTMHSILQMWKVRLRQLILRNVQRLQVRMLGSNLCLPHTGIPLHCTTLTLGNWRYTTSVRKGSIRVKINQTILSYIQILGRFGFAPRLAHGFSSIQDFKINK